MIVIILIKRNRRSFHTQVEFLCHVWVVERRQSGEYSRTISMDGLIFLSLFLSFPLQLFLLLPLFPPHTLLSSLLLCSPRHPPPPPPLSISLRCGGSERQERVMEREGEREGGIKNSDRLMCV